MHTPGVAPFVTEVQRLPVGAQVRARVVCHHPFGMGLMLVDRGEFAHVDIPFIAPGRLRGPEDFPPVDWEVSGTVAGYAGDQLRVVLYDPRA